VLDVIRHLHLLLSFDHFSGHRLARGIIPRQLSTVYQLETLTHFAPTIPIHLRTVFMMLSF
jgi:hypothetical protein